MVRPNRSFTIPNGDKFRFGFNGKERDEEFSNESYDFGARIYDGRVGRWLSVDPKAGIYPYYSPFVGFGNNPIFYVDPGGETLNASTDFYKTLTDGLNRTLGPGHGFSHNSQGFVEYKAPVVMQPVGDPHDPENLKFVEQTVIYTATQQKIIDKLLTVINDKQVVKADMINRNVPIDRGDGKSPAEKGTTGIGENGMTFFRHNRDLSGTISNVHDVHIFVANDSQGIALSYSVDFSSKERLAREPDHMKGLMALHEIGHAALRLSDPNHASHNTEVENFETNIRQIYIIGVHDKKSAKRESKETKRKVSAGDPNFLKGEAQKHQKHQ